ncbi:MAG: class I SAM-dependent methyltransferase [Oscillospiraceae bacterium]|nr:class I SAM-dependent methyltransferase [Oscillospiraceae bacterium]
MSSYGTFAQYYDKLTKNVCYRERAGRLQLLIEKWQNPDMPEQILLDLACGTGTLTEEFAKLGWDVIGIDSSAEMLSEALDKKYDSGLPVQYLQQDMRKLDLYGTVAVTVCTLDSLNHLPSAEALRQVLSRVNLFSEAGALFLFDLNTEYKHRKVLADNAFVYELSDAVCIWQNTLDDTAPEYPVTIRLDFFEQLGDDKYRRSSEEFTERIWQPETVKALLSETGFTLLEVLDGDRFSVPDAQSQRLLYIARAAGGQQMQREDIKA